MRIKKKMEYLENDLFSFFKHLSNQDKLHFAEYMFQNLVVFDLPENYLDDVDEEDSDEEEDEFLFEDFMELEEQASTYHISANSEELAMEYIHDQFIIRGFIVKIERKEPKMKGKVEIMVHIIGKNFYDLCYN